MKSLFFILQVSMICLTGCISTYSLTYDQDSFNDLNKKLENEVGKIVLCDGKIIFSENINISVDLSQWIEVKSNEYQSTDTWNIKAISYQDNTKGAFGLAILGFLIGTTVGGLIGWQTVAEKRSSYGGEAIGIAYGSVIGLTSGIVIGSVIGGIGGFEERYVLKWPK